MHAGGPRLPWHSRPAHKPKPHGHTQYHHHFPSARPPTTTHSPLSPCTACLRTAGRDPQAQGHEADRHLRHPGRREVLCLLLLLPHLHHPGAHLPCGGAVHQGGARRYGRYFCRAAPQAARRRGARGRVPRRPCRHGHSLPGSLSILSHPNPSPPSSLLLLPPSGRPPPPPPCPPSHILSHLPPPPPPPLPPPPRRSPSRTTWMRR